MTGDPFLVLGLKRDAIRSELKDAYHALALKHHPDKNPGDPTAADRFKDIQSAYETLLATLPETRSEPQQPKTLHDFDDENGIHHFSKPISRDGRWADPTTAEKPPPKPSPPRNLGPLQDLFENMEGSIYKDVFGGDV